MKCVSSCFSCICGTKSSARVAPSDSGQIIQPGDHVDKGQARVISIEDASDRNEGGRSNPSFILGDDGANTSVANRETKPTLQVKAIFIEVGKDRLLRVIHIPSSEDVEEVSCASSSKDKDSLKNEEVKANDESGKEEKPSAGGDDAEGDEEEDEYWFSKWARKPRFRSIFAKNPDSRPKINSEYNNNSMSAEESNKISAELEMKRAAAAAKRRAWAYNNNGNCEMTITHQPTVNTSDEEEFSSIAIVNSTKQQWSKNGGSGNASGGGGFDQQSKEEEEPGNDSGGSKKPFDKSCREKSPPGYSPFRQNSTESCTSSSSAQVQVQVTAEMKGCKDGIENPAFQDDDDDDEPPQTSSKSSKNHKTDPEENGSPSASRVSTSSTASIKSEDDIMTWEGPKDGEKQKKSSPLGTPPTGYTINAPTKKPLLFFIHSVAGSSDGWHHQMEFFQQLGYEIVVPDLLGHGLSSTPLNPKYYMFESLVQDLILIFDHFTKEDMKVVLVGHGYGASLAAMLTRVRLKNVALFIAIAGGGPTPLVRRTCCQDSWLSWKCKLFHSNRIRGRFDNPELKHVLPPTIHHNVLLGQVWGDGDSAFYRRITVPTLLVYGMRDKVVTLVEECEMERSIPKSFLELIENAGHQVMQEEPDKLNKMLYKFISSWS